MSSFAELARAARSALDTRPDVPLALATLVEVEGSSFRQPGARLLVDRDARVLAGAISGGCLEGDVAMHAADVCQTGGAITLRYDLRDDLETIWGFGSACEGVAHIVLEPLQDISWLSLAADIRSARTGGALVTIARDEAGVGTTAIMRGAARDGVWQRLGRDPRNDALANADGFDLSRARRLAEVALKTAHAEHEQDGAVRYFVEPLVPVIALVLVGAGRGAESFAQIASALGWDVTVIDHRAALLESLTLPPTARVAVANADDGMTFVPDDERSAVALLSHIYDVDLAWLDALRARRVGYIGVLGSRQRAARLLGALEAAGTATTHAVHSPIGLDLGGETPESIALAAIAEIEAVMHGRPGGYLRDRESPIHLRTQTPLGPMIAASTPFAAPFASA